MLLGAHAIEQASRRKVIVDPEAPTLQATITSAGRSKHPRKRETGKKSRKWVEGALQKANGKWANSLMFPGQEFDDLDEYRAAKKQRKERRAAYLDQIPKWHKD